MIQSLIIPFAVQQGDGSHSAIVALVAPSMKGASGIGGEIWMVVTHLCRPGGPAETLGGGSSGLASLWGCRALAILSH